MENHHLWIEHSTSNNLKKHAKRRNSWTSYFARNKLLKSIGSFKKLEKVQSLLSIMMIIQASALVLQWLIHRNIICIEKAGKGILKSLEK